MAFRSGVPVQLTATLWWGEEAGLPVDVQVAVAPRQGVISGGGQA